MLSLFFLSFLSLNDKIEISNKCLKQLSIYSKASTDLPKEVLPQVSAAINTVLFKNGKNLTQVNNISDAIIHCRGCSGKAIPAGPGLLKEMTYFDSYKQLFDPSNGTIARKLTELLSSAATKSDEGNLTGSGSQVLNCFTLGHYVPTYKYNIPFKCTRNGDVRTCVAEGDTTFSGQDYWDFESLSSNSFWQNLITEKIPEILVNLKGPAIPFGIPFEDSVHYKLTKEFIEPKPSPISPSQSQTPTSQPTTNPTTPSQIPVTSQPTTEVPVTSQPSIEVPVTSQPMASVEPTSKTDGEQNGGSDANSNKSNKKNKKTGIIVGVVVCVVVVVSAVILGVVWFLKKRSNPNNTFDNDLVADQETMQMSLIA